MKKFVIHVWIFSLLIGTSVLVLRAFDSIPYFTDPHQETPEYTITSIKVFYADFWNTMSKEERAQEVNHALERANERNKEWRKMHKNKYDRIWTQSSLVILIIGVLLCLFTSKRYRSLISNNTRKE